MKKNKSNNNEGIIWPPTYAKDVNEEKPQSHHQHPKDPGSDNHHAHDKEKIADKKRVWDEKNKQNLPPKKKKRGA